MVTGGAGFIGSHLVERLLAGGHAVSVLDNFSTGTRDNLAPAHLDPSCSVVDVDLLDASEIGEHLDGADAVFHLAANADVRFGWDDARRDLAQNVVATVNVLEAMRACGVRRLLFASTGSVYGEAATIPTPEDAPFPVQTSLYGASKLAAEGYLGAYAEAGHASVTVFRFVSILGPRYTHGHVIDFVRQLDADPSRLRVLGDGSQRKSYLHVADCVAAMTGRLDCDPAFEVFNLGTDDYCTVRESASWICQRMGVEPEMAFDERDRGWIGDNPFIFLDTSAIRATGWIPTITIRAAVESTVDDLLANPQRLRTSDLRVARSPAR